VTARGGPPVIVPGVTDALGARLAEQAGAEAVYLTGAGLANAVFGIPDLGMTTQTEVADALGRLTMAADVPVIADADTGYGDELSVIRTVRLFERAGASAIQFEDQISPKRCGHFPSGHDVIPLEEMTIKIRAALDARVDESLLIIARTDARKATGSIESAIERGLGFAEAGADAVFIEAPGDVGELKRVGEALNGVPLLVNVVEGGATPHLSAADYSALGFRIVLHANFLLRAVMKSGHDALEHLLAHGDSRTYLDRIVSWEDRQALFATEAYDTWGAIHYC